MTSKGVWDELRKAEVMEKLPGGLYALKFFATDGSGSETLRHDITADMIAEKDPDVGNIVMASRNRQGTADDYFTVDRSDKLGQGQFAICYSCTNKSTEEVKAVKEIERSGYTGDKAREFDEVKMLLKVNHPQCLGVDEVFVTDDKVQILQQKMCGNNLMMYLMNRSSGWLSEKEAGSCFHKIVEGVAFIHGLGICHRDLKPENILLAKDGNDGGLLTVKIADFGFAKELHFAQLGDADASFNDPTATATAAGGLTATSLGTFGYVAPEIIARKSRYNGIYVDNWSLGVILWILCVGEAPFKLGGATKADKAKVLQGAYKIDTPKWKKLPHAAAICKKLLVVDPKKRQTSKACLAENWVQNDGEYKEGWAPASAPPASSPPRKPSSLPPNVKGPADKHKDSEAQRDDGRACCECAIA